MGSLPAGRMWLRVVVARGTGVGSRVFAWMRFVGMSCASRRVLVRGCDAWGCGVVALHQWRGGCARQSASSRTIDWRGCVRWCRGGGGRWGSYVRGGVGSGAWVRRGWWTAQPMGHPDRRTGSWESHGFRGTSEVREDMVAELCPRVSGRGGLVGMRDLSGGVFIGWVEGYVGAQVVRVCERPRTCWLAVISHSHSTRWPLG